MLLSCDLGRVSQEELVNVNAHCDSVGQLINALGRALRSHHATREWVRMHTSVSTDPDRAVGTLGVATAALGVLFVCPNEDYSVVQETVTDETPLCPHDGAVLQRQPG